ncbi:unnamed protein product [Orchesella dallaii]|uniref:Uncharacterized protein n=1 Tax=Orchesella dallaii TaxID=48710 RepID=A0ABP1PK93_9HEXA
MGNILAYLRMQKIVRDQKPGTKVGSEYDGVDNMQGYVYSSKGHTDVGPPQSPREVVISLQNTKFDIEEPRIVVPYIRFSRGSLSSVKEEDEEECDFRRVEPFTKFPF